MLVLASNSPRRRELLEQAGIKIDKIVNPNIDETQLRNELPLPYVTRMSMAKCKVVKKSDGDFVLTADTIVLRGTRVLGKPENLDMAFECLKLLSGRRHRVITSVCLAHKNRIKFRNVVTIVKMKKLSENEINDYLESNEWRGKAGGYAIQGKASAFIPFISGSYTNVVGLPLTETVSLLVGNGFVLKNNEIP